MARWRCGKCQAQGFPASAWDASLRWHDGQDVYPLLQDYGEPAYDPGRVKTLERWF